MEVKAIFINFAESLLLPQGLFTHAALGLFTNQQAAYITSMTNEPQDLRSCTREWFEPILCLRAVQDADCYAAGLGRRMRHVHWGRVSWPVQGGCCCCPQGGHAGNIINTYMCARLTSVQLAVCFIFGFLVPNIPWWHYMHRAHRLGQTSSCIHTCIRYLRVSPLHPSLKHKLFANQSLCHVSLPCAL